MEENQREASPLQEKDSFTRKRSSLVGYFFVGLIFLSFIYVYAIETYINDFFQFSFFHDSTKVGDNCEVQSIDNQSLDSTPSPVDTNWITTNIPHRYDLFKFDAKSKAYRDVFYLCTIDTKGLKFSDGMQILHVGWVYGDLIQVSINGQLRVEYKGPDKAIVPLTRKDLEKPFRLLIHSKGLMSTYIGVVGKTPVVISSGFKINSKVLGIETSVQTIRFLYSLLPMLTLGLFFGFGWILGIRSRLVLATFFYFSLILFRNIIPFSFNYLPIKDVDEMYSIQRIFEFNSLLALLIFGLELLNILGAYIRYFMIAVVCLIFIEITGSFFNESGMLFSEIIVDYHTILFICLSVPLIITGLRKNKSVADIGRRRTNFTFIIVLALSTFLVALESILIEFGLGVVLNRKLDVLMPIFTSGIVIYTITLIEKAYRREKEKRTKMESDLKLAKEIQDSLAPPPPETVFGNLILSCYQIKHSQVAGDWMAVRKDPDKLVIVLTDVTGKGVQAALVVHAIQSLWAEALGNPSLDVAAWIRKVNRTLHTLGKQRPHSATAGIIVATETKVSYWSLGHIPAFAIVENSDGQMVKVLNARGSILGINEEVNFDHIDLDISGFQSANIYLGSDGVFAKGSRTRPRDISAFHDELKKDVYHALDQGDLDDDRTLIHLRKKT